MHLILSLTFFFLIYPALATDLKNNSEANEIKKRCLTVHGIHSAKSIGLADQDWQVPKDHLCDLGKDF